MNKDKEKTYIACDRCGGKITLGDHLEFANAVLCQRCFNVKQFDEENPYLYIKV